VGCAEEGQSQSSKKQHVGRSERAVGRQEAEFGRRKKPPSPRPKLKEIEVDEPTLGFARYLLDCISTRLLEAFQFPFLTTNMPG
jgi:hypothetical protein